ncbi:MAG: hypothetical protein ACXWQO_08725 [Bdellovibrionota bacterium]
MKISYFLFLLILNFAPVAKAADSIVGSWAYFLKIYEGQEMPEPPTATLRLRYEFTNAGASHLYWWHEGDADLCERRGKFRLEQGYLVDQVVWVNPKNAYGCNQDPDMQNGKITRTPVYFENSNLVMRLQFGEEELLYVWKKMKDGGI